MPWITDGREYIRLTLGGPAQLSNIGRGRGLIMRDQGRYFPTPFLKGLFKLFRQTWPYGLFT